MLVKRIFGIQNQSLSIAITTNEITPPNEMRNGQDEEEPKHLIQKITLYTPSDTRSKITTGQRY